MKLQKSYECGVHHKICGWPTKKVLCFRWSKNAKITLESISFWRNISISIFKLSLFLYTMKTLSTKSYQFFKIYKRFEKKKEKMLIQQSMRKEKRRKLGLCLIYIFFISQAHSPRNLCFLLSR